MSEIKYRKMNLLDIEQVYDIECECFSQPWSKVSLKDEVVKNEVAHYIVAESDGRITGYAGMWVICGEAHITNIAVTAEYRCRGIATNLILGLMQKAVSLDADCMTLEVRENNHRAQRIYAALGFGYVGTRRKYYSDTGENALILWNRTLQETLEKNSVRATLPQVLG